MLYGSFLKTNHTPIVIHNYENIEPKSFNIYLLGIMHEYKG